MCHLGQPGTTQATAAKMLGLSRATIARRVATDPVFGARVRAARARSRVLVFEAQRHVEPEQVAEPEQVEPAQVEAALAPVVDALPVPAAAAAAAAAAADAEVPGSPGGAQLDSLTLGDAIGDALERDAGLAGLPSARWIIALLEKTAKDKDDRAHGRAQQMLAELILGPLAAERDRLAATATGPEAAEQLQVRFLVPAPAELPAIVDTTARDVRNDS